MNQQILDQLIGPAPASTVDVDRVIRRTRRRRFTRRLAAGGSAAVAVVLAVGLGVSLAGGPRQPAPEVAAQPSGEVTPSSATPSGSAAGAVETDTEQGRLRTLDRLRAALEAARAAHAPATAWIYMPDVPGETRTPDGQVKMWLTGDDNRGQISFQGRSGITDGDRKGGFYLSLRPAACHAALSCSPLYECAAPIHECSQSRTPSGLKLVHWVDKPGRGWQFYGVDIALRDGEYALRLQAVNYFGGDGSKPVAPAPVLTRAQLDAMATGIADSFTG